MNRNGNSLSGNWLPTLSVGIGGFIGAIVRYQLTQVMAQFQWAVLATWAINVSGSFVLSWLYTMTLERYPIHPYLRLGIGTGMLGAYTTYSTFAVETWSLWAQHHPFLTVTYVVASIMGSLGAAIVGYRVAFRHGLG